MDQSLLLHESAVHILCIYKGPIQRPFTFLMNDQPRHKRRAKMSGYCGIADSNSRRIKKVTDPLSEVVRTTLCDSSSSSSSSNAEDEEQFLDCFEDDGQSGGRRGNCGRVRCNCNGGSGPCLSREDNSDSEDDDDKEKDEVIDVMKESLHKILSSFTVAEKAIQNIVNKVVNKENYYSKEETSKHITVALQTAGFSTGVCKSKWKRRGDFPPGEYEYIDVVDGQKNEENRKRSIVDVGFSGEFQIARPSALYQNLCQILPNVFVGGEDKLKQTVEIMCNAAKASWRKEGMPLPPWRRKRFMLCKWFDQFTRYSYPYTDPPKLERKKKIGSASAVVLQSENGFIVRSHHQQEEGKANKLRGNVTAKKQQTMMNNNVVGDCRTSGTTLKLQAPSALSLAFVLQAKG